MSNANSIMYGNEIIIPVVDNKRHALLQIFWIVLTIIILIYSGILLYLTIKHRNKNSQGSPKDTKKEILL